MTPTYFIYNIFKTVIGNDSNVENEGCIVKLKQENKNNFYHIFFRLFYVHEHHRDFSYRKSYRKILKKVICIRNFQLFIFMFSIFAYLKIYQRMVRTGEITFTGKNT